eukprot:scaffold259642_cov33-Tisochrysis_lutea.AAC.5
MYYRHAGAYLSWSSFTKLVGSDFHDFFMIEHGHGTAQWQARVAMSGAKAGPTTAPGKYGIAACRRPNL